MANTVLRQGLMMAKKRDEGRVKPGRRWLLVLTAALVGLLLVERPGVAHTMAGCPGGNLQLNTMPNSSPVLHYPEVFPIFWGSHWSTSTTSPTLGQVIGAVQDIVNGPYLGALKQYTNPDGGGPLGLARMVPRYDLVTTPFPNGATFTQADVTTMINAEIAAGRVPLPNPLVDMVYSVFLQDGETSSDSGFQAYHHPASYQGTQYYYMWVRNKDTMTGSDSPSALFSHELVEAISNPASSNNGGVTVTGASCPSCGGENEIADVCDCGAETIFNTYSVKYYWSQRDNKCVVPEGWTNLNEVSGGSVKQISAAIHQAYTGTYNGTPVVVATDVSDNIYLWNDTAQTWSVIGGPGAVMFAVTGNSIWALLSDASAVWAYQGGSTPWASIGTPNGLVTSVVGGGQNFAAVTDFASQIWTRPSTSWVNRGGAGQAPNDKVVANGSAIVRLGGNHQNAWAYGWNGNNSWTQVDPTSLSDIFMGTGSSTLLGAAALQNPRPPLVLSPGGQWVPFTYPNRTAIPYVVTGNNAFVALASPNIVGVNSITQVGSGWHNIVTSLNTSLGVKVLDGGNNLFYLYGVTYCTADGTC